MKEKKSVIRRWFDNRRHFRNKERLSGRFFRIIYYRLIVPMKREKDQPRTIAYGVFFGLLICFTPTVGIQMPLCILFWWLARRLFNFHFSLILSIAWSWLSNPATVVPLYFIYYKTGNFILNFGEQSNFSFARFRALFADADLDNMEGALQFLTFLWETIGLSIWIGCIPYAIILALTGYHISLAIVNSYQKMKKNRHEKRRSKEILTGK